MIECFADVNQNAKKVNGRVRAKREVKHIKAIKQLEVPRKGSNERFFL